MCPDPSILSAYRDGEVPSPWAERIAAHVAGCPDCAARIASFARLSSALSSSPDAAALEAAKARVSSRLEDVVSKAPAAAGKPWHRYLVLPLPLVAAAAALLVAVIPASVYVAGRLGRSAPSVASASDPRVADPRTVPVSADPGRAEPPAEFADFASLLDYLNEQEGYIRITVDIPPNRNLAPGGPAEIMKGSEPSSGGGR